LRSRSAAFIRVEIAAGRPIFKLQVSGKVLTIGLMSLTMKKCPRCQGTGEVYDDGGVGEYMKSQRLLAGHSLSAVARVMALTKQHISDLENGQRGWRNDLLNRYRAALDFLSTNHEQPSTGTIQREGRDLERRHSGSERLRPKRRGKDPVNAAVRAGHRRAKG